MKVATFNVNGVNGRLPRLLEWLAETTPDIVCLQETKTDDSRFPALAFEAAGYGAIWHGQRSHHGVAILARGETPVEVQRRLPGDEADAQARYLEAQVQRLRVASIYLPNGNPQPGPKFDYKLAWFERLLRHAQMLMDSAQPVVLAGDFNVVPTNADIYNAWLWRFDAVLQPETRQAYQRLLAQGWVDATRHLHLTERIYTFWVHAEAFRRNAGFRMDFLLLHPSLVGRLKAMRSPIGKLESDPNFMALRKKSGPLDLRQCQIPTSGWPIPEWSIGTAAPLDPPERKHAPFQ